MSTAGRREWTKILCSVTASTSRVAAFFGPRLSSNVERLPPLEHKNTKTLWIEAAADWASTYGDFAFLMPLPPTLKEAGRTQVGLATDCHGETAVDDRGERERALVHTCLNLAGFFSRKMWNKKTCRILESLIAFYASNSPALRCEASGWRGTAPFAWSERYACEENVIN